MDLPATPLLTLGAGRGALTEVPECTGGIFTPLEYVRTEKLCVGLGLMSAGMLVTLKLPHLSPQFGW